MRRLTVFGLALSVLALLSGVAAAPATAQLPVTDVVALEGQARASLLAAYRVLVTGAAPTFGLVDHRNEIGLRRTAGERLNDLLYRWRFDLQQGLVFTNATVALSDVHAEVRGGQMLLRAREEANLGFRSLHRAPDPRDVTTTWTSHTFTFEMKAGGWSLVFDDVSGFRDAGPAHDDHIPAPAGLRPTTSSIAPKVFAMLGAGGAPGSAMSNVGVARVAAFGTYDRTAAGNYAYNWAYGRNPSYRDFSNDGGDCTNFASQALRAGGWQDKTGWYLDWNNWWYNSLNQTQSWTYVPAMKQFVYTSGRGSALAYLNDLLQGDMVQVDFGANGSWDHTAIVDSRYSTNLADIYISYHTTDTRHRSLADFLAAVPIPGNSYMAWNIVATTN